MPSTPTSSRASVARRPEMQPTTAKRPLRSASPARAPSGTAAWAGSGTIGASVPSMSVITAAAAGLPSSGAMSGSSAGAVGALSMALVSPPVPESGADPSRDALLRLAAVGTAAGLFSGLFGVGGGTVIVPLLILWFGFGERLATGTSLAAIVPIGLLGALAEGGIYGNVHLATGLLLSVPAVAGVLIGTAIQQRISQR